jgi:hypothetical protein
MKRSSSIFTLFLIVFAIYWSFRSLMPAYKSDQSTEKTAFSTDRALEHVEQISQKPHAVGFAAHQEVRGYIIGELQNMGLETTVQEGYTAGDWGNLSKVINILARIKGAESGKALLLLSHYDSSSHSSFGASDAGSGVATIIEGIRAFLAENKTPKNDIIILITDAEELGLNGADLFVNAHPWNKDVGLVLNFEARGSGGPSYMLIETNRGNANLIKEFTKANPKYPVANSLAYSIYKMLPNDTDLTVFRKDGDIEGFNFAFIDDHFDYHTAQDTYERLDRNTLAHQGSYLMPLLHHFSQADLSQMKSLNDSIYFNAPFFKLVSYPYDWIWIMFGLAVLCFILLLMHGFRKKVLGIKEIGKGFLPMIFALIINGLVGFYSWSLLKWMYPHYKDILHGFTYNGHTYILAFALCSVAVCFWVYHRFNKVKTPNLLVAPIVLWLLICGLVGVYLPGASFFIIPVFGILAAFLVVLNQKVPNPYLMVFLALPAIFIFTPFIKMFPVGLGLKMMVATTLLSTLTFILVLPTFGFYRKKKRLAYIAFIIFFGCMISAHFNSGFTSENAKPTSLLYVLDADTNKAQWATYENSLSTWTNQFLNSNKKAAKEKSLDTLSSKYNTVFTYLADAPTKQIPEMQVEKTNDTIIGDSRLIDICIIPNRHVNRLEIFTPSAIESATVNTIQLSDYYLKNRQRGKLVTHYISNNEYTDLRLSIPKDAILELTLYEASNDLLTNEQFTVPARPDNNIPMPFVWNDAVLVTKTVRFE